MMSIVQNVSEAITRALKYVSMYMGAAAENISYRLNEHFYDKTIDPNVFMMQLQMAKAGVLSKELIRENLKKFGLIPNEMTDEDIDEQLSGNPELLDTGSSSETGNTEELDSQ
jgi:hypothetical protein